MYILIASQEHIPIPVSIIPLQRSTWVECNRTATRSSQDAETDRVQKSGRRNLQGTLTGPWALPKSPQRLASDHSVRLKLRDIIILYRGLRLRNDKLAEWSKAADLSPAHESGEGSNPSFVNVLFCFLPIFCLFFVSPFLLLQRMVSCMHDDCTVNISFCVGTSGSCFYVYISFVNLEPFNLSLNIT